VDNFRDKYRCKTANAHDTDTQYKLFVFYTAFNPIYINQQLTTTYPFNGLFYLQIISFKNLAVKNKLKGVHKLHIRKSRKNNYIFIKN
jgi:hypothetical protein